MQSLIELLETRTLLSGATLQVPEQLAVGAGPVAIATGDFNGDSLPDLVTANTRGTVSILLNTGNGTFAAAQTITIDGRPTSVAVGDFTGKGRVDIAVAEAGAGVVAILPNEGNGTFGAPTTYIYGTAPGTNSSAEAIIVAGDFSGNGKIGLAVADETDGKIVVFPSNGNGSFASPDDIPFTGISDMVAGNFTSNGRTDLAVIQSGTKEVKTLLSAGGGAFGVPLTETLPIQPTALAAGDFNGDGNEDLAIAMGNNIDIAFGSGQGRFTSNSVVDTSSPTQALAVGDFYASSSGSGDSTGFAAIAADGAVTVFQNNGSGIFTAAQTLSSSSTTTGVSGLSAVAADFSGDGDASLAFPLAETNSVTGTGDVDVLLSQTPPRSTGFIATLSGALPTSAVSGSKTRLAQVLTLTNNTAKFIGGKTTVNLYLSTTPVLTDGASPVLSFTRSLNLLPRASRSMVLLLKPIPAVAPGSYYLIASATSTTGSSATARSAATIILGAPFINLAALSLNAPTSVRPGARFSTRLTLQNLGNSRLSRTVPISLAISTRSNGAVPVTVAAYTPHVSLTPAQKRTGSLSVKLSSTLAPGTYYLVATVDPNNTLNSPNIANNTAVSGKITVR